MSNALIVGIDVAKKDFAVNSRVGEVATDWKKFANQAEGYAVLHKTLESECTKQGLSQIHLIVEATGGYEASLLAYGYEQGWWVSMPNPKQVREWAKGVGYRA